MKQPPSFRTNWLVSLTWIAAVAVFMGVEVAVIAGQLSSRSEPIWSLHFSYLPIMVSLPLTTALPLSVQLNRRPEWAANEQLRNQVSYWLGLLTLIAYLTLWISIGRYL